MNIFGTVFGVLCCLACMGVSFYYLWLGNTTAFVLILIIGTVFLIRLIVKAADAFRKQKKEKKEQAKKTTDNID